MTRLIVAASVAVLVSGSALAQPPSAALDGNWVGQWRAGQTNAVARAEFTVKDLAGSWRASYPGHKEAVNPCLERAHPATIRPNAAGGFRLSIEASKTMRGCHDSFATLRLAEPNRLVGKWDNGVELDLVRK